MPRVVMIPLFALALLAGCSAGTPAGNRGDIPQASVGSGGAATGRVAAAAPTDRLPLTPDARPPVSGSSFKIIGTIGGFIRRYHGSIIQEPAWFPSTGQGAGRRLLANAGDAEVNP